ncbi:PepSY1/2 domain-containing protein [Paenisporosarcina cavernae]|uniref:Spore gernimation protein n=1 Tax=Paenisporosarcina cavernae TaxID=2320858 RepID=A0A385YV56_9BACL|nr:PepSY1/2 domain-containing protein [Paenisporosarcina cavernae]AYC29373.1 spore gernimation protein [Paenisporosarcina cavernae]
MKIVRLLVVIAAIAFFVLWIQAYSAKKDVEQALQAQYTQRISDTSEKMVHLRDAVDQSRMFEDPIARQKPLEDVWRLSSELKNDIGMLPIHTEFRNQWMNYLGRLGNSAQLTAQSKIPAEKWDQVAAGVVVNMKSFEQDWNKASSIQLSQPTSIKQTKKILDEPIAKTNFNGLYTQVKKYSESDFPLTTSEEDVQKKIELKHLKEKKWTQGQVEEKFKQLFPELAKAKLTTSKSKKDAPYPFFEVSFKLGDASGYADFTEKGGNLLSFINNRPIGQAAMSQKELREKGKKYLQQLGIQDVQNTQELENNLVWHFAYARVVGDKQVKVYDDSVQLKLAKDNGQLLGVNTMEYIQKEKISEQEILPIDTKTFFTPDVIVQSHDYAYTENDYLVQRLVHDFVVTQTTKKTSETFRVLVDTETFEVLKVQPLT